MKLSRSLLVLGGVVLFATAAQADDVSNIAREMNLPVPVVDNVFRNVDAFFASPDAPANHMTSGIMKGLALKAVKSRLGSMDDSQPGKVTESSDEESNATYKGQFKITRHETTETGECVDGTITLIASEGVPVVKDGTFGFDTVHPKVTSHAWKMTFCRTPINGGSDYTDWQLSK